MAIEGGDPIRPSAQRATDQSAGERPPPRPGTGETAPPGARREYAEQQAEVIEGRGRPSATAPEPLGAAAAGSESRDDVDALDYPEAGARPHPELTATEAASLDARRQRVVDRHPDDYARLLPDPDHGRRPPGTNETEEASTALDMREQRMLPADVRRPDGPGKGDFVGTVSSQDTYFDMKRFRDQWPPESGRPPNDPFPPTAGGYSSGDFTRAMEKQIRRGRHVVLETQSLKQQTIDDMARIVDQKGWGDHVTWYP
jgi:hypothetical protein